MTATAADTTTRYAALLGGTGEPGFPSWLNDLRSDAAKSFQRSGLPSKKQEAWRYTSLDFLQRHEFVPLSESRDWSDELKRIEPITAPHQGIRLVLVNGRVDAQLSTGAADAGLQIGSLATALASGDESLKEHLGRIADTGNDAFAAMNLSLMADGSYLKVPKGAVIDTPIEIVHVAVGNQPQMVHPRHLVVVEDDARVTLSEHYISVGNGPHFTNVLSELSIGRDARVHHERLQEEGKGAHHLSALHVRQDARSAYHMVSVSLGAAWSRTALTLTFSGEEASAELDGLYLAGDGQLSDMRVDVRHKVPKCTSRETFKGILDGRGRAVFDGRIEVARDAQETDASLSNDNLMLSRKAEVDTKPLLEIYADNVRCSHGTTVGQLDDRMMFYLQSRGIDKGVARQMLCMGFAQGTLANMSSTALHQRTSAALEKRLMDADEPASKS